MRRVAVVTDWFAPRRGGIEAQLGELAARLSSAGVDVEVITSTPGANDGAAFPVRRLDVCTFPSPPLAISPTLVPRLREELRRGWDVVHAHVSVVSPTGWTAAWVARSLGLPCVVTFHSILRGKAVALRAVSSLTPVARSRVAWTAVSETVAQQARWALGESAAVSVLPNGTDVAWWRQGAARAQDTRPLTLVTTMRLHPKKRGRALVRAFASATRGSGRPVRLLVIGDGPDRAAIERDVRELGSGNPALRVELRGWLDREALRAIYADADGFVMASVHEAFGIAALEAAAAGLPVVARRSGVAELVRHDVNGLLLDSDDALAGAMRSLIEDDALRERLRPVPSQVSRFDWGAVVAAHLERYDRAIRRAASAEQPVGASA
jgi:glycosyltransferase involved in cell wall biosynthesis